jgi:hypothetical protein
VAENIGFIGLGVMGKPMAGHLIKAGHRLTVHNRSRGAVDERLHGSNGYYSDVAVLHEPWIAQLGLALDDAAYFRAYADTLDFQREHALAPDGRVKSRWAGTPGGGPSDSSMRARSPSIRSALTSLNLTTRTYTAATSTIRLTRPYRSTRRQARVSARSRSGRRPRITGPR